MPENICARFFNFKYKFCLFPIVMPFPVRFQKTIMDFLFCIQPRSNSFIIASICSEIKPPAFKFYIHSVSSCIRPIYASESTSIITPVLSFFKDFKTGSVYSMQPCRYFHLILYFHTPTTLIIPMCQLSLCKLNNASTVAKIFFIFSVKLFHTTQSNIQHCILQPNRTQQSHCLWHFFRASALFIALGNRRRYSSWFTYCFPSIYQRLFQLVQQ